MSGFAPDSYELPRDNKYYKFAEGDNKFRVVGDLTTGYEYWATDSEGNGRPKRSFDKFPEPLPADAKMNKNTGLPERQKHIWVMPVLDLKTSQVMVLQVHQAGIQEPMLKYSRDKDWGHPAKYDITITRDPSQKGRAMYSFSTTPPKPLSRPEVEAVLQNLYNCRAIFADGDPSVTFEADYPINEGQFEIVRQFCLEHVSKKELNEMCAALQGLDSPDVQKLTVGILLQLVNAVSTPEATDDPPVPAEPNGEPVAAGMGADKF